MRVYRFPIYFTLMEARELEDLLSLLAPAAGEELRKRVRTNLQYAENRAQNRGYMGGVKDD